MRTRIAVAAVLFIASAFAQVPSSRPTTACGSETTSFKVKLDESPHPPVQPEPGKALIYFIHDAGTAKPWDIRR